MPLAHQQIFRKSKQRSRRLRCEALERRDLMAADPVVAMAALPDPSLTLLAAPTVSAAAPFPLNQTFNLSSRPTATKTIYLDFNGHTTRNTFWNDASNPTIVTPAFSLDGNQAFSVVEQERIQRIYLRVAEDFAPFNVNVTTRDPGAANLVNSGGGDTRWGTRVSIGGNGSWFGAAGGVAFINSFGSFGPAAVDTPCFVFTENLGAGNEKFTADATVHEIGHTLGLVHDGRTAPLEEYYQGHGSGPTGWAPSLGVGYSRELVQFSKGEYANASNLEDDLALITTNNGFGYRPDDHGQDNANARALTLSGNNVSGRGVVERNTDRDRFTFTTRAGTVNLRINPSVYGANLDIIARLYNSAGQLVASSNPQGALNAVFNRNLPAGRYYVDIAGTGQGNPLTTGYSKYGSLGQYTISGTILATASAPTESAPATDALLAAIGIDDSAERRRRDAVDAAFDEMAQE